MKALYILFVSALLSVVACDEGGEATGATCPTANPPTYEGFAKGFMETYCVRCHKGYANEATLKKEAAEIDAWAAKGPNATNTAMPEGGTKPTDAEPETLGQFLACVK